MNAKQQILNHAEFDYSPHLVGINNDAINSLKLPKIAFELPKTPANHIEQDFGIASAVAFLIALNSINFVFWTRKEDGTVDRYKYKDVVGAHGMTKAFTEIWGDFGSAVRLRGMCHVDQVDEIDAYFPGIPMQAERAEIFAEILAGEDRLEETAHILTTHFIGSPLFTSDDAQFLADAFPKAYSDRYLKKAQLTIMEIASLFNANPEQLHLTVAADYQIPKVLRGYNILNYSPIISGSVDNGLYISANSIQEKAIRAATVLACEEISRVHNISTPALDWWLWSQRNEHSGRIHLTLTTNY